GTTAVVLLLQVLASLKVFDQIYLLTGAGPGEATRSLLLYIYDVGFTGHRFGYGAAGSYLFPALVLGVAALPLWISARRQDCHGSAEHPFRAAGRGGPRPRQAARPDTGRGARTADRRHVGAGGPRGAVAGPHGVGADHLLQDRGGRGRAAAGP